jgi:hypothetical protein
LFKGRNIQEFSVGDTSVGDTSTLHPSHNPQAGHYVPPPPPPPIQPFVQNNLEINSAGLVHKGQRKEIFLHKPN